MIEAVIGHGQLYVFILCLALKPHSTVPSDKGTVREGDGSVWPQQQTVSVFADPPE